MPSGYAGGAQLSAGVSSLITMPSGYAGGAQLSAGGQ